MRIQNVEHLDLSKLTIVAKVDLAKKSVKMAKCNIHATEKMIGFDEVGQRILSRQRIYKEDVGNVGEGFAPSNVLLAYDEEHLKQLLGEVHMMYEKLLGINIQSLESKLDDFVSVEWKGI